MKCARSYLHYARIAVLVLMAACLQAACVGEVDLALQPAGTSEAPAVLPAAGAPAAATEVPNPKPTAVGTSTPSPVAMELPAATQTATEVARAVTAPMTAATGTRTTTMARTPGEAASPAMAAEPAAPTVVVTGTARSQSSPMAEVTAAAPLQHAPTNLITNATPGPSGTILLGDLERVPPAGFAFRPPNGFDTERHQTADPTNPVTVVFVGSNSEPVIMALAGSPGAPTKPQPEALSALVKAFFKQGVQITAGTPYSITVGGAPGTAADLTGGTEAHNTVGQAVLVAPSESQVFFAIAVVTPDAPPDWWPTQGSGMFQAMLRSIGFFRPEAGP